MLELYIECYYIRVCQVLYMYNTVLLICTIYWSYVLPVYTLRIINPY